MRWLCSRHRCVLLGVGCLVAVVVRCLPARAEPQFIPIPEIIVDPNEGTTVGILPVILMSNESKSVSSIIAPDVRYNDTFGVYPTFRYFGYPDPQTRFSIIAGKGTKSAEDVELGYSGLDLFDGWLDVDAHAQREQDPFERFYGFGNNTPSGNQTNYGSTTNGGSVFAGLNFYASLQASLQARLREVHIGRVA